MNDRVCKKCILDNTVSDIFFDEEGICNYCRKYDTLAARTILRPDDVKKNELDQLVFKIKNTGKNKKYDCVLGVSGGVDSSYLSLIAKELGLRPLVVHFDNGWNSEQAVSNIENIVKKLNFDLFTFVMDWEEFKDLQLSYFKASVIDLEIPTDQLIFAALNKIAYENGIKYILSGYNVATEAINPYGWSYEGKFDYINLKSIHNRFGSVKLEKLPKFGFFQKYWYYNIQGISTVKLLNYVDYNKKEVKEKLKAELNWKDYGGKHYESIFTRFYQGYILPKKFNVDKRKSHLSNLIMSAQISRDEALIELKAPTYDLSLQEEDRIYVAKKIGLSVEQLDELIALPVVSHKFYGADSDRKHFLFYFFVRAILYLPVKLLRKTGILHTPELQN